MACPNALSDKCVALLYEIYGVTLRDSTAIVSQGDPTSSNWLGFDYQRGVREQLARAIDEINAHPEEIPRVAEILGEYDTLSLDRSTINKDGLSLIPERNIKAIQNALYSYTGILISNSRSNKVPLG